MKTSFLTDEALKNLKNYKYSSLDLSPVSNYILKHYWNWAITLFPLWMAPNLITLIGFGFIVFNVLLILLFIPDLESQGPPWIYFSFAAGLWLYSTFDNVDGKQARRTGTSSPLGELFDHGCDALNVTLAGMIQATTCGMGYSWYTATMIIVTATTFYVSTWETYYTGTLFLGYINGPTEGVIMSCISMVFTGIYGVKVWREPATNTLPSIFGYILPSSLKLVDVCLIFVVTAAIFTQIPVSIRRALDANKIKGQEISLTLRQGIPFALLFVSVFFWIGSSKSVVVKENVFLFGLIMTFVFGRMAAKVVLAHVTHTEFPSYSLSIFPMYLGAILVHSPILFGGEPIFTPQIERLYLWLYFLYAITNYFFWTFVVTTQICRHLNIECFRIPHSKSK